MSAADAAATEKPKRKPPQRGKAGGRAAQKPVRFTAEELATVEARAEAAGMKLAGFLRAAALGVSMTPRARRRPTVERAALIAATAELNRVGNNVNQIARSLNRGREAEAWDEALVELRAVLATVREALRG